MSAYDLFIKKQETLSNSNTDTNIEFLTKAYPAVKINQCLGEDADPVSKQAVVINKQEQDMAYLLVNADDPVEIGSVWEAKGLHLLVAREIVIIKDVKWRKYYCYLCNAEANGFWLYFCGPKKTAIQTQIRLNTAIVSTQSPVIVAPSAINLRVNDKFELGDRGWIVREYDNISTAGVTYYTVAETTIDKKDGSFNTYESKNTKIPPKFVKDPSEEVIYTLPGKEIELETADGYVALPNSGDIRLISRQSNKVTFAVNYNVNRAAIAVMQNGEEKRYVYSTVMQGTDN